jgi:hypothetical protein
VALGDEVTFRYYLGPRFAAGEISEFNRIEIDVPDEDTHIDTLKFDDRPLTEVAVGETGEGDPLADVTTQWLAPTAGTPDSLGQFAQAVVTDTATGNTKLLVKVAPFGARYFRFSEQFEIVLRSRLYRGSKRFSSSVWNDRVATRASAIPQPTQAGDVTAEVATDDIVVVAQKIGGLVRPAAVVPNPFSPNGDGINDQVCFAFDLFLVLRRVTPELTVYEMTGREVQRLEAVANTAGRVEIVWDGRDADGCLVPPGNYLYRLRIGSDEEARGQTGVLSVAY